MEDKKTKKISVLMIITIAIFVLTIGGATYAYLIRQIKSSTAEADVETLTYTTDSLIFDVSGDISIRANTDNFAPDAGNMSATSIAKASLLANNKTNIATMKYSVFVDIKENDFVYTTDEKYPELLMTVIDPNGNEVTSINGLNYVVYKEEVRDSETDEITQEKVAGFDVTTKKGINTITIEYPIKVDEANTEHYTEQEWKVKITFVNLDSDQEENARRVFDIDVNIGTKVKFADYLKQVVYGKDSTLLLHNSSLTNGAGDNNYRYSGASASVKNYVCFGSDAKTCPANNLYRIIGMFDDDKDGLYEVKLINNSSMGTIYWGSNNTYSTSTVRSTVNGSYLSGLGAKWQEMITKHTWKVGGVIYNNSSSLEITPKVFYDSELRSSTTSSDKIGLMYVSDFGFSATKDSWGTNLRSYGSVKAKNWLYSGLEEWTITRVSNESSTVYQVVGDRGFITITGLAVKQHFRPCFYLKKDVLKTSGTGTSSDPYRLYTEV